MIVLSFFLKAGSFDLDQIKCGAPSHMANAPSQRWFHAQLQSGIEAQHQTPASRPIGSVVNGHPYKN